MTSTKKTMGVIGCIVIYIIGLISVIREPETVGVVLVAIVGLVIALFGIKTAGGVILQTKKPAENKEP